MNIRLGRGLFLTQGDLSNGPSIPRVLGHLGSMHLKGFGLSTTLVD